MTSSKPSWKKRALAINSIERLLNLDVRLSQQLSLLPGSNRRRWVGWVAHLGDGPLVFGGLGLVYGLGWLGLAVHLHQAVLMTALLIVAVMAVVTLTKFVVRRPRPQPPGEFVTFQYDAYSFPSGHAARLAALAVGLMFFDRFLGWSLIVLAVSVAAARVTLGIHYVSDVVIGLALGALLAWAGLALLQ